MTSDRVSATRPRVLIFAYACEPGRGSEPGVGWSLVQSVARFADPVVLVCPEHIDAIRNWHESNPGSPLEFELVEDAMWLLPAQFEGHLVWSLERGAPERFHLHLPSRDTNYDINYRRSVDIGHLPEFGIGTPGHGPAAGDTIEAARKRLRAAFYPSDRIAWHASLAEAIAAAEQSGRRLHVMQLFGTLDDESC